jgi:hypothetical protein
MQGPNPDGPANYRGSNTTVSKQIVDVEIAMHQSAGITTETITIESLTTVTTATKLAPISPGKTTHCRARVDAALTAKSMYMSRSGWRSTTATMTTHGAHHAPPKTRRWTGRSARRRPPAAEPCHRRTSECPSFRVVTHTLYSRWLVLIWWSPFLPIDPGDMSTKNSLRPMAGTLLPLLSQPNTPSLLLIKLAIAA